jgi:hypothetical protein
VKSSLLSNEDAINANQMESPLVELREDSQNANVLEQTTPILTSEDSFTANGSKQTASKTSDDSINANEPGLLSELPSATDDINNFVPKARLRETN